MQIVDGTVCRYRRAGDCAVALPFAMMPTPTIRAKRYNHISPSLPSRFLTRPAG